jgi:hypothetical protein
MIKDINTYAASSVPGHSKNVVDFGDFGEVQSLSSVRILEKRLVKISLPLGFLNSTPILCGRPVCMRALCDGSERSV